MKKIVFGMILGVLIISVGAYLYFALGFAPVATSDPMMPFETLMAKTALHARIEKDMPKTVPIQADEAAYTAGARVYMNNCAVCHGSLNAPETAVAKGMFPPPPQLLPPRKGVTDDPAGETFWKVKNGIRLTGMPGFHASLTDEQAWQVSLLLANADKLPASVMKELAFAPPAGAPPAPPPATKRK